MLPDKIHALLVDEEMARVELLKDIDSLLEDIKLNQLGPLQTEDILLAIKEYIVGVKELSDLLKEPRVTTRDTEPQRMSFDYEKAAPTQRCVAPKETDHET
jgi:hypothetical protein